MALFMYLKTVFPIKKAREESEKKEVPYALPDSSSQIQLAQTELIEKVQRYYESVEGTTFSS